MSISKLYRISYLHILAMLFYHNTDCEKYLDFTALKVVQTPFSRSAEEGSRVWLIDSALSDTILSFFPHGGTTEEGNCNYILPLSHRVPACSFYKFLGRVLFHHDGCNHHWDFWPVYSFWTTLLGFLWLGNSGSATTHLPGYFCPWKISLDIGWNMLPSDSFMSCLDSLLGYSTG